VHRRILRAVAVSRRFGHHRWLGRRQQRHWHAPLAAAEALQSKRGASSAQLVSTGGSGSVETGRGAGRKGQQSKAGERALRWCPCSQARGSASTGAQTPDHAPESVDEQKRSRQEGRGGGAVLHSGASATLGEAGKRALWAAGARIWCYDGADEGDRGATPASSRAGAKQRWGGGRNVLATRQPLYPMIGDAR
jgi:hypothetical protein